MAVAATAVVWLLGPTLLSLMFDDERRSQPLTVLDFVRVSGEPRPSRLLALGDQYLLARITRKSAFVLALKPGDQVFAQIKSAAILNEPLTRYPN